jgi:magnesium-transporting ATPase (P-type)
MKQMGIRVWVLTGDKTETAVDIAKSCKLFGDDTKLAYAVMGRNEKEAEDRLLKAYSELDNSSDCGLVLDGTTVQFAMANKDCRKLIFDLGINSRACVCARLSPMQKLELVKLVRHHAPHAITLSVGDGANDVPMIYGAHVGVAVRGKEGTQAVQASDVAISQFRFLAKLLQCHGRRAYRRVAVFLIWYIYKNIAEIMCDVIWMHQDQFRARIAIPEFLSIQYNVTLTSWHILFVLGYDLDIPDEVALANPDLYKVGPQRDLFKPHLFIKWLIFALIQGTVTWILPQLMINGELLDGDDYRLPVS